MAVYVDPMFPCIRTATWRWAESCHLIADSLEELHAFAQRIGMRRAWFQTSHRGLPHYDLTAGRRAVAVKLGAIEITQRELVERIQIERAKYNAGL